MAYQSPECTCNDLNCPNHPSNHSMGCSLCIAKNQQMGEIPSCFFKRVRPDYAGPGYFYQDFANAVQSGAVLQCIASRRSCRSYLPQAVPEELLMQVIEAGRSAPSGGNNQSFHFLAVTSREVLAALADMVQAAFEKLEVQPGMYPSLVSSITRAKKGGYVFHYHAPAFIIVANRKGYGNAMADSACALENMMIAANDLGLGTCWINQLHWLAEESGMTGAHPDMDAYLHSLGMGEDEYVCGCISLGYPAGEQPGKRANKSVVTMIR